MRASAAKILARLSKATLQLYVVDSAGLPVANADGEITLGASVPAAIPGAPVHVVANVFLRLTMSNRSTFRHLLPLPRG